MRWEGNIVCTEVLAPLGNMADHFVHVSSTQTEHKHQLPHLDQPNSTTLNQTQPELQLLWIDVREICWIQQVQEDVQDLLGRIRLPPLGQIDHRHGVVVDVTALPQSLKVL